MPSSCLSRRVTHVIVYIIQLESEVCHSPAYSAVNLELDQPTQTAHVKVDNGFHMATPCGHDLSSSSCVPLRRSWHS